MPENIKMIFSKSISSKDWILIGTATMVSHVVTNPNQDNWELIKEVAVVCFILWMVLQVLDMLMDTFMGILKEIYKNIKRMKPQQIKITLLILH